VREPDAPWGGLRAAIGLLTVLPGGGHPSSRAVRWFGPLGAAVGAAVGTAWWLAQRSVPWTVAAAIAVAVDLALTGFLHVDGLADSGDGLLPPLERARRLEVMAKPDTGAFGMALVVVVLLLRFAAFASMGADPALVAALWVTARLVMAATLGLVPPARATGLTAPFRSRVESMTAVVVGVPIAGVLVALSPLGAAGGLAAVAGAALAGGLVVGLARRRLGGYTGDVLGAAGLIAETVGLVVASGFAAG